MKVLMLGWEFPPFFAGGAGIVCAELTKALNRQGTDVTYIMPHGPEEVYDELSKKEPKLKIVVADNYVKPSKTKFFKINSILQAYQSTEEYENIFSSIKKKNKSKGDKTIYGGNLKEEVHRFAEQVVKIIEAEGENFDVIHAQDWTTIPAAIALKEKTGKPMVVHIHITEFDKTGGDHADPEIYAIEKKGMELADKVITVSNKTRQRVIQSYFINPNKVEVVHNAATPMNESAIYSKENIDPNSKIVMFAGRVTLQKGPDYFIDAAKKVLEHAPETKFIMAGTGDMLPQMIRKTADMGMSKNFMFTGFYTRDMAEKLFSMADVYVMPSVSEPFGVIPYEAQIKHTPTIVSKQTGVSEVLSHTLKTDFWDVNGLAGNILALLKYPILHSEIQANGYQEAKRTTWDVPASKCINIYSSLIH